MLDIVIIGAGGFGREVYCWALDSFPKDEYRIKGFLSNRPNDLDGFSLEACVLADPDSYALQTNDRFVFAIGDIQVKKQIVNSMKARGAKFLSLIHPTAVIAPSARIGDGVIICPFVVVSDSVTLGDFVTMNFYSSCGHDTAVGKYGIFSPYATANGFVTIEDEVFVGTHATITAHRRVGRGARLGAGSLTMRDVPPFATIMTASPWPKTMTLPSKE